jgi:hypothetical protein
MGVAPEALSAANPGSGSWLDLEQPDLASVAAAGQGREHKCDRHDRHRRTSALWATT